MPAESRNSIPLESHRLSIRLPWLPWIAIAAIRLILAAICLRTGAPMWRGSAVLQEIDRIDAPESAWDGQLRDNLERLAGLQPGTFRTEPYVRAAAALQKLGRKRACEMS